MGTILTQYYILPYSEGQPVHLYP